MFNFDRGHLASYGAFIYKAEMEATQFYLNVVPQNSNLNRIDWLYAERVKTKVQLLYILGQTPDISPSRGATSAPKVKNGAMLEGRRAKSPFQKV